MRTLAQIPLPILACFLAALSLSCVFVDRYSYASPEGNLIRTEATGRIEVERHVGFSKEIPIRFSSNDDGCELLFERDPSDFQGGLIISAPSSNDGFAALKISEPPLAVPRYGACRAYYRRSATTLYFFDKCPESPTRTFKIVFELVGSTTCPARVAIPYSVQSSGIFWEPDSL
jgi:hypothetical protein